MSDDKTDPMHTAEAKVVLARAEHAEVVEILAWDIIESDVPRMARTIIALEADVEARVTDARAQERANVADEIADSRAKCGPSDTMYQAGRLDGYSAAINVVTRGLSLPSEATQ